MKRYRVHAISGDELLLTLLIPFPETSTVGELRQELVNRVQRQNISFPDREPEIRHCAVDGPVLDSLDILQDVLRPEDGESVYAISAVAESATSSMVSSSRSSRSSRKSNTHRRSRRHGNSKTIEGTIRLPHKPGTQHEGTRSPVSRLSTQSDDISTYSSTARESDSSGYIPSRLPLYRGSSDFSSCFDILEGASDSSTTTLRPQSSSETIRIPRRPVNNPFRVRIITPKLARQGVGNISPIDTVFSSRSCIQDIRLKVFEEMNVSTENSTDTIDIYIQDVQIETPQYDINLSDLGIEECLVNGVLDVFVIVRPKTEKGGIQGLALLRRLGQTDRGCAAFLACFRVFNANIKTSKIDEPRQDGILRAFYHITQFFPILRIVRALMGGYTVGEAEVSLLALCFAELLHEMLDSDTGIKATGGDPHRIFEGSRLIFAYILDLATQIQQSSPANATTQLLSAYRTIDCMDAIGRQRIYDPVQTTTGIVSRNVLAERSNIHENGTVPAIVRRILLLSDTDCEEYSYFDYNGAIAACARSQEINSRLITDLGYLSNVCFANGLSVLQPANLNGVVEPPCLTWNSDGLLAVFLGHAACALPGRDLDIWLPVAGNIVTIDAAIFTQMLQPIIESRERDGTMVFEESGPPAGRKETDPSELIIFAVDCSRSMNISSEFLVNKEGNKADPREGAATITCNMVSRALKLVPDTPTSVKKRQLLLNHPSFNDMIAIVQAHEPAAKSVIDFLISLENRRLGHLYQRREEKKATLTDPYFKNLDASLFPEIRDAFRLVTGLDSGRSESTRILKELTREGQRQDGTARYSEYEKYANDLEMSFFRTEDFKWNSRQANIEQGYQTAVQKLHSMSYSPIPHDCICPINHSIFEDPVSPSDGFVYERSAIRSWLETFEKKPTSPMTGVNLENIANNLRSHLPTKQKVLAWIRADDIIKPYGDIDVSSTIEVTFRTQLGLQGMFNPNLQFKRHVPMTLSTENLYRIAYRGLKGEDKEFGLACDIKHLARPREDTTKKSICLIPDGTELKDIGIGHLCIIDVVDRLEYYRLASESNQTLVKLYNKQENFVFSFWHSMSQTLRMSEILMKIWRHRAEKYRFASSLLKDQKIKDRKPNFTIWYAMRRDDDGILSGNKTKSWHNVEEMAGLESTGCLEEEDLVSKHPYRGGQKVFKLFYSRYESNTLTRLDVSKEIFSNFINRTIAYNYATHCGLLPFNSTIKIAISQSITFDLEAFRGTVMNMSTGGNTPLWDALVIAIDELNKVGANLPNAKKRIICLSDGADTSSSFNSCVVLERARESEVVIDCFCIGSAPIDLVWVCHNTGGYKFNPKNMEESMGVVELEPVLSVLERPNLCPFEIQDSQLAIVTSCSRDSYPQRKKHANMHDIFTKIEYLDETGRPKNASRPAGNFPMLLGNTRVNRILSEIRRIASNPHPYYDVYVSDENIGFWKIIMQGPSQSAYSIGAFSLYLDMDESYPLFAPKARFITPMLHPNINKHGKICHSIFDRNWTTNTTNVQVLQSIFTLLSVPETTDAMYLQTKILSPKA
ncbi:hypothetical protein TWF694_006007 [Orbilia ellipsospora]|uniref:peptidylprolyl isomerase n=1 Tax=Orbilia ellipsospora TaxID=2528407 RepID=A0AAV9WQZ3_9PEZI